MLKVGLNSYSMAKAVKKGEIDIFGIIRFTAEQGGKHIEIVPGSSCTVDDFDAVDAIAKAIKEAGLEISSYTVSADFMLPTAAEVRAEIERLKQEVIKGARMGASRMRHDAGWRDLQNTHYEQFEKDLPIAVDACGEIADFARQYGIVTSVENHGMHFQGSERVLRLIQGVNRDNFRMTVDVGNFLCVDEDPEIAVQNCIRYASMIHFKDFTIRRDPPNVKGYLKTAHGRYLRGACIGDGDIPLTAVMKTIVDSGYDGFLSIEYEGFEDCREACARSFENVAAMLEKCGVGGI
ncbi:MAG: sugar phosphate isomerase/epimerase [Lentisphaeria bacterium]|nr:sugar phosphate isomerase/epimerase [Lentisphaeria bacterium]